MKTKKKSLKKKTSRKKNRVRLAKKQVIFVTLCIFFSCAISLALSVIFFTPKIKNQNVVTKNITSPQNENKVVTKNITSPQNENKVVTKNITSSQNENKVVTKNITTPQNENKIVTKNITSPQNENKVVTKNITTPQNENKVVTKNITSPQNENKVVTKNITSPEIEIPISQNGATLVFVFDDAGQNIYQTQKILLLPFPLVVAVLPRLPYSRECAKLVRDSKNQVILHQPMRALNQNFNPGDGALESNMTHDEIVQIVLENILQLAPISGVNNHEGSLISENLEQIGAVLDAVKMQNLFFLDSRTTAKTKVPEAAAERGMKIFERDVFLDNTKNRDDILEQLFRGLQIANKKGRAIFIAHVWSADVLVPLLSELFEEIKKSGYKFDVLR